MKNLFASFLVISLMATACTKSGSINSTDDSVISDRRGVGPEDNPNGGGGNNVNATAVPTAVLSAFASHYPTATNVQWKKLSNGTYKAEFFIGTVKWQAIFAADGTLLKEEHV